jgi:hypothetical protein
MLISFTANAQCKDYIIGVRGDTLNCVDIKGKKQGRWVVKVESLRGERGYEEEGEYINNKKEGTWRRFSLQGDLTAIEGYRWGNKNGQSTYINQMGDPIREESWRAVNPDNPYDTVNVMDPNNPGIVIRREVVKMEGFSLKHGTWKYYAAGGVIEKTENWYFDKPARRDGDELLPIDVTVNTSTKSDTVAKKVLTKPQAILDYEKKNSGKKKIKVRDGKTGG